jgi:hypothetical protein
VPEIVGVGAAVKLPDKIVTGFDVLVTELKPLFEPVTLTVMA